MWLPEEPDLSTARILTFGYNANFAAKKEQVSLSIGDFANDLLFHMKYDNDGDDKMGEVPIIIVAHSMGGGSCVQKGLYVIQLEELQPNNYGLNLLTSVVVIHGHLEEQYHKITSSIKAVLFMAIPHRGTDLAESLNRILTSSIFGQYRRTMSENSRKAALLSTS
ncbi:hypothetical protein PENCOP_c001G08664 [Penicillium coprophilum]|uniref:GPI inositol-deacylase n=1 Tax=Penicillium coprophilum TaxID=36646 RepID=A0A1V6V646_9EURO|nr:hypothetical protein PENCOP_c001G08664 [Penicillium coprophilum]